MGKEIQPAPKYVDAKFRVVRGRRGPASPGERVLIAVALIFAFVASLCISLERTKASIADREAHSGSQ